jgi:AAA domain
MGGPVNAAPPVPSGPAIHVTHIRLESGTPVGSLVARASDAAVLYDGEIRLRPADQAALARLLRDADPAVPWAWLITRSVSDAIEVLRQEALAGVIELRTASDVADPWIIPGFAHTTDPVVLFADGGDFKSTIALGLATAIHTGDPCLGFTPLSRRRVLYLDWEMTPETHKARLQQLVGSDLPDLLYRRCALPLAAEAPLLGQLIEHHRVGFVIIDSAGFAADGPPEQSDVALRIVESLRYHLRVPALILAHVTKAGDRNKPFGSVYWHNAVRSTWFIERRRREPGEASLALHQRKNSHGELLERIGLTLRWADGRLTAERFAAPPEVHEDRENARDAILRVLAAGPASVAALAEQLGLQRDTVAKRLREAEQAGEVENLGSGKWQRAA